MPHQDVTNQDNNRKSGRLKTQDISCSLGQVLDLSASGMRVLVRGKPTGTELSTVPMTIHAPSGPFSVMGKIVWIEKIAFRRYEMGIEFVDLTPGARSALSLLARGATLNTTVYRAAS